MDCDIGVESVTNLFQLYRIVTPGPKFWWYLSIVNGFFAVLRTLLSKFEKKFFDGAGFGGIFV